MGDSRPPWSGRGGRAAWWPGSCRLPTPDPLQDCFLRRSRGYCKRRVANLTTRAGRFFCCCLFKDLQRCQDPGGLQGRIVPRTLTTTTASPGLSRAWGCSQEGICGFWRSSRLHPLPLGGGERSPSPLNLGGMLPRREAGGREGGEEGARVRPCVRPSPCAMTVERGAGEEGPPPGGRPGLLGIGCRNPSPGVAPPPWACLLLLLCGGKPLHPNGEQLRARGQGAGWQTSQGFETPSGGAVLGNGKGPEQDLVPRLQISPGATTLGQHPGISSHLRTSFLV